MVYTVHIQYTSKTLLRYEGVGKPVWSSYCQSSHRWLPQQCWFIKRSQHQWGSNLSSTGLLQTQHMGTGPVGVLGKFRKGGTSLQNMQGSKSGARSVELVLTNVNFCFTSGTTFTDGGIESEGIFATLSVFCFGWMFVIIGRETLSTFLNGGILMEGRTGTVRLIAFSPEILLF